MLPVKYIAAFFFIFSLIFLGSCFFNSGEKINATICIPPYIVYGDYCCLDRNDNVICDYQEISVNKEEPSKIVAAKPAIDVTVMISKVIDGETAILSSGQKIRLIGIEAPIKGESGYNAALKKLQELVEGKEVGLEKDREGVDNQGRLLRYLWVNDENVNFLLVREGLVRVKIISPNTLYNKTFLDAEFEARSLRKGIWAPELDKSACDERCLSVIAFNYDAYGDDCENLNGEYVALKNTCDHACDISGWAMTNSEEHIFIFPEYVLRSADYVFIYSGPGNNSGNYLYWDNKRGICDAVWNNDKDTLYLKNLDDQIMLKHSYFS
ncbi:MAG: lamin tail domain-containing protein [Nanoarchaeota archaeon]